MQAFLVYLFNLYEITGYLEQYCAYIDKRRSPIIFYFATEIKKQPLGKRIGIFLEGNV